MDQNKLYAMNGKIKITQSPRWGRKEEKMPETIDKTMRSFTTRLPSQLVALLRNEKIDTFWRCKRVINKHA